MNINDYIKSAGAVFAMALCGGATAHADHDLNILEAKADALHTVMLDLDQTFVRSYVRSRVFGEIMATSGQIKAKSVHLRVMARHGTPCDWEREIRKLDRLTCRLDRLVGDAHYRARYGLDPPIGRCAVGVGQQLKAIDAIVQCMRDALVDGPVVTPHIAPPAGPNYQTPPQTRYDQGYPIGNWPMGNANRYSYDRYQRSKVYYDRGGITFGNGRYSFRINF